MVFITGDDGIARKYACKTCIKGHRSTRCQHTDRELVEIKRKGRPISQCESCRQLRKTKQLHIKCICTDKATSDPPVANNTPTPPADDTFSQPATPSSTITTTSITTTSTITTTTTISTTTITASPSSYSASPTSIIPSPSSSCLYNGTSTTTPNITKSESSSVLLCKSCDRSPCLCLSTKPEPESYPTSNSTDTSPTSEAGPHTPEDIIEQHRIPPPLSSLILPPIRLPMSSSSSPSSPSSASSSLRSSFHPRKLAIPIHDPHDDIDSDTPIYKSEENNAPDRGAVLGSLSDTRHEDLMKELYGPFQPPPKKRQRRVNGETNSAR
ncbi:hypothetical protein O0I10_012167 [Lichtheimia ornata]|uniref:Copper-fist domain-containing protein n=1 Tax=Lichtheimia ornata TaxID=688661 RepID=A0AAD7XTG0_9FUNG|nr:uncharacterized protein O0I10_012167 [Lichtheimia ornata]KAJ8652206.1 hypothetical protein O0I10_012167 [Lichtheimia ornata]